MQSRNLFAKYAKKCTPHFADGPSAIRVPRRRGGDRPELRVGYQISELDHLPVQQAAWDLSVSISFRTPCLQLHQAWPQIPCPAYQWPGRRMPGPGGPADQFLVKHH